ncbi:hypothetical protein Pmar_PMAR005686 [Perkinsus marinus ATCC 50983]|uniref:Uncharacterized protein n=1 Tax=Perkinsus marinus (strain ATCC 50983 / TXsc) TaxID=423536 RepID=C5KY86_PERM5|nr:hypothetical protein Pmar_PMAR005686 [Perkinsus marinus ATCC 50983]EER10554.1 hypothetical protein Pmar_PMAR005686 [Perkinsus marinus ATCC 50983]|eukprot:XP_002778759.1 hypothetical protein Pmar_PMAR005686 [Perkinsus marinus ATCC 50983]
MAAAGDQLDLSGIVLDPPVEPTTAGSPIDWSGITIEPPIDPATGGSQVDWSGVSLEAPVSTTTGGNPDWSNDTPEDQGSTATEQPNNNK